MNYSGVSEERFEKKRDKWEVRSVGEALATSLIDCDILKSTRIDQWIIVELVERDLKGKSIRGHVFSLD